MDINRTGPRKPQPEEPAQLSGRTNTQFKEVAPPAVETGAPAPQSGMLAGVTQADLRDSAKAQETLMRCFGDLLENSGQQLGQSLSDSQKRDVLEFLANDPLMKGKLLKYLEQVVK